MITFSCSWDFCEHFGLYVAYWTVWLHVSSAHYSFNCSDPWGFWICVPVFTVFSLNVNMKHYGISKWLNKNRSPSIRSDSAQSLDLEPETCAACWCSVTYMLYFWFFIWKGIIMVNSRVLPWGFNEIKHLEYKWYIVKMLWYYIKTC